MSNRTDLDLSLLSDYIVNHSVREDSILNALREETAKLPLARMQIAPEQGQFMKLLVTLIGAKRAIEVGTFTGYSAISVARALPTDGQLICCDISEEWANIAKRYWEQAQLNDIIELKLGSALETLDDLLKIEAEQFDFVFIDADKPQYTQYYERAKQLLRPGGLIAIDNVLWSGRVVDDSIDDEDTAAIRSFNKHVYQDQSVDLSLVPIADGLTLARKR